MENKMKPNKTLISIVLAGTIALAGCGDVENSSKQKNNSNQTTFVMTAREVRIEPHYGIDPILMDGITVKRFAYGNGLDVPNIEESTTYVKGSPGYETLRPLLTVERSR